MEPEPHPTVNEPLRQRIEDLLTSITAEIDTLSDREENPFGLCSRAAAETIRRVGHGTILGYWWDDNPGAKLGKSEGGHDFAIIDCFLVDLWAHIYYSLPGLYDHTDPDDRKKVTDLYGDPQHWVPVTH